LFERITGMSMKARPATIGGFAQSIHDFQGLREFLTAVTLTSLIDLPFVALMLVVIGLLGGWLVVIPLLAFPITMALALFIQVRLRDTVQKSLSLGAVRQALLIETLGGLETLKACSAESERQHQVGAHQRRHHPPRRPRRNLSSLATNGTLFIQQFCGMATIVAGVYSIIAGNLSVGALVASYMLGSRVLATGPDRRVDHPLPAGAADHAKHRRADEPAAGAPGGPAALEHTTLHGGVSINVTFRYPGQAAPALNDVSFSLKPGERIGIMAAAARAKAPWRGC
jgi:ATP-binding cassette subfamily C protein LapB